MRLIKNVPIRDKKYNVEVYSRGGTKSPASYYVWVNDIDLASLVYKENPFLSRLPKSEPTGEYFMVPIDAK